VSRINVCRGGRSQGRASASLTSGQMNSPRAEAKLEVESSVREEEMMTEEIDQTLLLRIVGSIGEIDWRKEEYAEVH
jgi:hypothetical protein